MISRSLFTVAVLGFLFAGIENARAQADLYSFAEGHVFDSKTLRPLQRANVSLVGFQDACPVLFSGGVTDSGGFFQTGFAYPNLDSHQAVELVVQCTLKKSGKRVTYTTNFYSLLVGGRVYTRDLYIKIPDGDTGCVEAPFSPPKHQMN